MQKDLELHVAENEGRTDQLICEVEETKRAMSNFVVM